MVMNILHANNVLRPNKTFATVLEKVGPNSVAVFMEQSQLTEVVQCAPNAELKPGDYVLVEYINNNPQDKFVMALIRSISSDIGKGVDWSKLAQEPIRLQRNPLTKKVEKVFYGEDEYPPQRQWNQELHRDVNSIVFAVTSTYPDGLQITRYILRDNDGLVVAYK